MSQLKLFAMILFFASKYLKHHNYGQQYTSTFGMVVSCGVICYYC